MSRLQEDYKNTLAPQLAKTLGFSNPMQVPKITKVTLNMGVGETTQDRKVMDRAMGDMEKIAGQKPIVRNARKSVATFKIRDGWPVGCKVTLRGIKMWEFLDRAISLAIPRIKDFRGLSPRSFDGRGNYTFGISEKAIFPEINQAKMEFKQGMDVTVVTTAKTNDEARSLLTSLGFPFRN